jgi:uncharacterized protein (TIGR02284 family)
MSRETTEKALEHLININKDACKFYDHAADQAESYQLQVTFRDLSSLHREVAADLEEHLPGKNTDLEGTVIGSAACMFSDLIAKFSKDSDETFVVHLEEAEDRCLHSLQDAITKKDLPKDIQALLTDELSTLQKTHDYMKSLKDYMKAT